MRVRTILFASMLFTAPAGWATAQTILENSTFELTLLPWAAIASSAPDPVATGSAIWTNTQNLDNVHVTLGVRSSQVMATTRRRRP